MLRPWRSSVVHSAHSGPGSLATLYVMSMSILFRSYHVRIVSYLALIAASTNFEVDCPLGLECQLRIMWVLRSSSCQLHFTPSCTVINFSGDICYTATLSYIQRPFYSDIPSSFFLGGKLIYLCGCCIICACCSANLWPILSEPAMNLETQRETHPDSRAIRDLVVKSSMQASKQRSTRPENICGAVSG